MFTCPCSHSVIASTASCRHQSHNTFMSPSTCSGSANITGYSYVHHKSFTYHWRCSIYSYAHHEAFACPSAHSITTAYSYTHKEAFTTRSSAFSAIATYSYRPNDGFMPPSSCSAITGCCSDISRWQYRPISNCSNIVQRSMLNNQDAEPPRHSMHGFHQMVSFQNYVYPLLYLTLEQQLSLQHDPHLHAFHTNMNSIIWMSHAHFVVPITGSKRRYQLWHHCIPCLPLAAKEVLLIFQSYPTPLYSFRTC